MLKCCENTNTWKGQVCDNGVNLFHSSQVKMNHDEIYWKKCGWCWMKNGWWQKKKLSMNNKLSDDGWILIHYGRKTWFMNKPLLNLIDPTQECTNMSLQIDHRWIKWANFGNHHYRSSNNGYRHGHHFGLPFEVVIHFQCFSHSQYCKDWEIHSVMFEFAL